MKKRLPIALALSASLFLAACAAPAAPAPAVPAPGTDQQAPADPAPAPAADPIRLVVADNHPETHPSVMAHRYFEQLIFERSNGELIADIFPGAVLGGEGAVIEQVQMGATQTTRISSAMLPTIDDAFAALFLPYIWNSREDMFRVLDGEVGDYFAQRLHQHGMHILAWHDPGTRNLYNALRPIYTPEDLAGMRIRVQESELMINLVNAMGASAVPMPMAELYMAIQTGLVDGAENNWPTYALHSHYEVAGYFTVNEHSIVPEPFLINLDFWNSLSAEHQEILFTSARDAAEYQRVEWAAEELRSEEHVVAAGATVARLTPEQRAAFAELAMTIYADYADIQYHIDMIRNAQ
ncbi:MAG: TRAP transporter substrate-binding protein [Defluviitaleaceae bacterium]|nr:TRAP transporter substrate-binding protein [Defluviitaleaceae bacterium]